MCENCSVPFVASGVDEENWRADGIYPYNFLLFIVLLTSLNDAFFHGEPSIGHPVCSSLNLYQ